MNFGEDSVILSEAKNLLVEMDRILQPFQGFRRTTIYLNQCHPVEKY